MRFKTNDGIELYYEVSGQGFPCIYLHGGPGYWSKSFQHHSQGLLEDKLEMIYLDQRGCRRSDHSPDKNYSLNRLIDDIEELREYLDINEFILMGHSFGGILAVNYANRFPGRTKGLILSNVTLDMFDSFVHQMTKGTKMLELELVEDLSRKSISEFMEIYFSILVKLIATGVYFKFQYTDLSNKAITDAIDREGLKSDPSFQQYIFSSEEFFRDFTILTNKILCPTLVVAGKYDDAVGPLHHKNFEFRNLFEVVLESSHHPYVENHMAFKKAIMDFVENDLR